jgi:hypothetical protein
MSDLLGDVLIPPDVKLTERQRMALDFIETGQPVETTQFGALMHAYQAKHETYERCQWCKPTGNELGRALRNKGLVKYSRKLGGWVLATESGASKTGSTSRGPGDFPEGY